MYCWFSMSRRKTINPKLLSEKTQEYYGLWKITRYSVCPSLEFVRFSVSELSVKMFHTNLQNTVWKRYVGAHADGHQHGGRKSMKTSGIDFCYKRQSDHSHEQVNIHINTSRKTSTVPIDKNHRMRHFVSIRDSLSGGHLDVVWRESLKFIMVYLKDGGCYGAKSLQQDIY